jgi:hypothetical protein
MINKNRFNLIFACFLLIIPFLFLSAENQILEADRALYVMRCTQCHAIEMAASPDYLLPSQVMPMIETMRDMPGSKIQQNEVKRLYQYALYDNYTKLLPDVKKKLGSLSSQQQKAEIKALKEALESYK